MARKKATKKQKGNSTKAASTAKSSSMTTSSISKKNEDILCKISLVFATFFVMSAFPNLGLWVLEQKWWVWLAISLIIGWKPLMTYLKK